MGLSERVQALAKEHPIRFRRIYSKWQPLTHEERIEILASLPEDFRIKDLERAMRNTVSGREQRYEEAH